MLVCAVSLQVPRTIAAEIAETAVAAAVATSHIISTYADIVESVEATAATVTEGIVFAGLVDAPASATDTVNAFLGQLVVEAASASDAVSAGSAYGVAIDEGVTAVDAASETTSAISTRSAMVAGRCPVFINPGVPREANAGGVMINL